MNEFLEQFLIECRELLQQATSDLLELEQNPADRDRLDSAFRAFHTMKGAAGIVDFHAMGRALHTVEDSLAAVRAGKAPVTTALITRCLSSLDRVAVWLNAMEATEEAPVSAEAEADALIALFASPPSESSVGDGAGGSEARHLIEAQIALLEGDDSTPALIASAVWVGANVLRALGLHAKASTLEREAEGASRTRVQDLLRGQAIGPSGSDAGDRAAPGRDETSARAVRIDVGRIDALVKLTGELTTAKNAVGYVLDMARRGADAAAIATALHEHHAVLDRLTGELQRSVLNVRVLPMRHVFRQFPRVVREMSGELGKPARLITEGEDAEADKAVVEALFEPLLHVIRNAIDHGVESSSVRAAAGKPAVASIVLRALRAGENIAVEVEDDGAGIDVARVRRLAVERGIVGREAIDAMDDAEVVDMIFTPGFSTASVVTAISGRGVGMDSVRAAVETLGGRVTIENRPGRGTLVRLLLPFTLMMTRVMTVEAGGQAFGIPFDAVIETVRISRDAITKIGAARAFIYRDRTTPLIGLSASLGVQEAEASGPDAAIVVADVGSGLSGFEVDRVGGVLNVMLSPLEGLLAGASGIAGATLLGDGRVMIVLDLQQIAG